MPQLDTTRRGPTALSPAVRRNNLARLGSEEFDLLVIGGGINGAGIARDAALRGLRVALIEKGRLRQRHQQPISEAHPRRVALSGVGGLSPGARGLPRT